MGSDSFYVRVNLNIEPHGEPPSLGVSCDDIIHVTDTRHKGKYNWRCSLVDQDTAKPLQAGTMPNYNRFAQICRKRGSILSHAVIFLAVASLGFLRAQQLLLVRLRKMALEQKNFRKKVGGLLLLKSRSINIKGYNLSHFSVVFEENIDASAVGQSSRPKLPWPRFQTASPLHSQQT